MLINGTGWLDAGLLYFAIAFTTSAFLLVARRRSDSRWLDSRPTTLAIINLVALAGTLVGCGITGVVLVPLVLGIVVPVLLARRFADFSVSGQCLLLSNFALSICGLLWGTWFIATLPVSDMTRILLFAGYPLLVLSFPIGLLQTFETWESFCRDTWRRPREPLIPTLRDRYPRVCLQVPTYAEPPEIVIATLDALARLDYPNFEVMVIDNNTTDPALWKPLEAHCRFLGDRFRFFHVEKLSGAKAGALNFANRHLDPAVKIIGVIDCDYLAEPDFISALVGYFDDEKMGFVQTPHDYREWEGSAYQRMCYWEYKSFFATTMLSLNERDAALTVGTMCLVRRRALEEAGGWSEWCQTEDSELSIRIHACGYSSVFVPVTYGRGLIPETFAGYKKQRFRWTFGPIQEFRHHLGLFLPRPWGRPSRLTSFQKLHHLNHGLGPFSSGLGILLSPLSVLTAASTIYNGEVIYVPLFLWFVLGITNLAGLAIAWLTYGYAMGCSLKEALGAMFAKQALAHIAMVATVRGLFTDRIPWRRTNKFKSLPGGLSAFQPVLAEILMGTTLLTAGILALTLLTAPQGFLLLLALSLLWQGVFYFAAPVLVLLSEEDIKRQTGASRQPLFGPWPQLAGGVLAFSLVAASLVSLQPQGTIQADRARESATRASSLQVRSGQPLSRHLAMGDSIADLPVSGRTELVSSLPQTPTPVVSKIRQVSSFNPGLDSLFSKEVGMAIGNQLMAKEEVPVEVATTALITDTPTLPLNPSAELIAWNPPTFSEDCYLSDSRLRDYRCRNRKN